MNQQIQDFEVQTLSTKHGVIHIGFINDQENNGIKNRKEDGIQKGWILY